MIWSTATPRLNILGTALKIIHVNDPYQLEVLNVNDPCELEVLNVNDPYQLEVELKIIWCTNWKFSMRPKLCWLWWWSASSSSSLWSLSSLWKSHQKIMMIIGYNQQNLFILYPDKRIVSPRPGNRFSLKSTSEIFLKYSHSSSRLRTKPLKSPFKDRKPWVTATHFTQMERCKKAQSEWSITLVKPHCLPIWTLRVLSKYFFLCLYLWGCLVI